MTLDAFDAANNPLVLDLSKLVAERDMPEADAPEDLGNEATSTAWLYGSYMLDWIATGRAVPARSGWRRATARC